MARNGDDRIIDKSVREYEVKLYKYGFEYNGKDSRGHHTYIYPATGRIVTLPCSPKPRSRWRRIAAARVAFAMPDPPLELIQDIIPRRKRGGKDKALTAAMVRERERETREWRAKTNQRREIEFILAEINEAIAHAGQSIARGNNKPAIYRLIAQLSKKRMELEKQLEAL